MREGNEDSFLASPPTFAVADGMGGANGGEVASAMAVEVLRQGLRGLPGGAGLELLAREADRAIRERARRDPSLRGMGTTLTAVRIDPGLPGGVAQIAHVGDSRAYLLRAGRLRRLTRDHTLVDQLVRAGQISAAAAATHPSRNVLLNVLGGGASLEVDESSVRLKPGDRLLLCTDGVTGLVDDRRIAQILSTVPDPRHAARALVATANLGGGHDNSTAIVIDPAYGGTSPRRARVGQTVVGDRHEEARGVIRRAWQLVHDRSPTERELAYAQAISLYETGYGRSGQFGEFASRGVYNWGALQRRPLADGTCPSGTVVGRDAANVRCFVADRSDLDAARSYIASLTANRSYPVRTAAILRAMNEGSAEDVAAAMKLPAAYFEAPASVYGAGIRRSLVQIGSSVALAGGSMASPSLLSPAAFVVAGALGLGAYFLVRK